MGSSIRTSSDTTSSTTTITMRTSVLLLCLSLAAVTLQTVFGINCYHCQDMGSGEYYDPTCGMPDYHGRTEEGVGSSCLITIAAGSGITYRGFSNDTDGLCFKDAIGTLGCTCTIHQCNNNLCEQCS